MLRILLFVLASSVLCANGPKSKSSKHGSTAQIQPYAGGTYFRPGDVQLIARFFPPHPLPPGLQKKYRRTGSLPPGWQKKMQVFPPELSRRLPPLCAYCGGGVIEGHAVIYDKRTQIIYDIAALAADILR